MCSLSGTLQTSMGTRREIIIYLAVVSLLCRGEAVPRIPAPALHLLAVGNTGLGATAADICSSGNSRVCRDCSTVQNCYKIGETYTPGTTITCSGNTPYCEDGECVATLSDAGLTACAQGVASTTFVCPNDDVLGYYPDPSNCQKYHFCDGSGNAFDMDCTPFSNTIYNYQTASCTPRSQATCFTFNCNNGNIGRYQTYNPDPSVYLVCMDNQIANARMAKCPRNYEIDATDLNNVNCKLTCLEAGRIQYSDTDTSKYYECVSLGGTSYSAPIPSACPGNSTFSLLAQRCVFPGDQDSSCSASACTSDARGCGCS